MGLIRIQLTDTTDITASGVRLHLVVAGETLVMGNAATERVREVREVTRQLQQLGAAAADIQVRGVEISNRTGLLTKGQKARFQVVVRLDPSLLPPVLGMLAEQQSVQLQRLEWLFDGFEAGLLLAAQAMTKARRRADAIAGAAGQRIVGVANASDSWEMPVSTVNLQEDWMSQEVQRAPRGRAAPLDAGVAYSSVQVLTVQLTVDFQLD